jgi:hypothetical protein
MDPSTCRVSDTVAAHSAHSHRFPHPSDADTSLPKPLLKFLPDHLPQPYLHGKKPKRRHQSSLNRGKLQLWIHPVLKQTIVAVIHCWCMVYTLQDAAVRMIQWVPQASSQIGMHETAK